MARVIHPIAVSWTHAQHLHPAPRFAETIRFSGPHICDVAVEGFGVVVGYRFEGQARGATAC